MTSIGAALPTPTPLEVVANLLLGDVDNPARLPPARGIGARAALEEVIAPMLARPPCFVSFSGGRDSSAILAVAVHVARREGLDLPIPASNTFPGVPEADETEWQELVLEHLGIRERAIVNISEELDALGPIATAVLERRGVLWPGNAYMHGPVFELARGGTVLTGVGGDELFDTRGASFVLAAHRRERPSVQSALSLAMAVTPRAIRAAVWRRRHAPAHPWLTPDGRSLVGRALAADAVRWPHRWNAAARHWSRTRAYAAVRYALPVLAADAGVELRNPFVEPAVLAEVVQQGGAAGFSSRSEAMAQLFGDLLPVAVLERSTKAAFSASLFGPLTRAFAEAWDGSGVDERYVHPERLRREWLAAKPDMNMVLLLQMAWLAAQRPAQPRAASS